MRRKGPRSPSADTDDSSHRRRSRKYDRSPSPRRNRYRRSRSRNRRSRSGSRDMRMKESNRAQDWKQFQNPSSATNPSTPAGYVSSVLNQYSVRDFYLRSNLNFNIKHIMGEIDGVVSQVKSDKQIFLK